MRALAVAVLIALGLLAAEPIPSPACLVPAPYHCDPKPR